MRNILIVAGGVVAVAAIALGVCWGPARLTGPAPTQVAATGQDRSLGHSAHGPCARRPQGSGDPDRICLLHLPHCAHFATQILPEVNKKLIDSGKVKLIYRDFPLDQTAVKAAQLAECSGNDRYYAVVDMIFQTQANWAAASDPIAELAKSLRIAGMGDKEVKACLANDAMANAVIADYRGGETLGVNSTPTLFINGQQYRGTRNIEELDAAFGKLTQ